jgi:hypothetical protein
MGAACAIGVFCVFSVASAADWADLRQHPHDIVGTLSCSSVACHGNIELRRGLRSSTGQEYLHWLEGSDPHALASRRLVEPRFQEVLKKASHRADGAADPQVSARCANCHDPLSLVASARETALQDSKSLTPALSQREGETAGAAFGQGIGCESCHGGARRWLTTHFERDTSREQLRALGMTDTKQVLVRARLCAACASKSP